MMGTYNVNFGACQLIHARLPGIKANIPTRKKIKRVLDSLEAMEEHAKGEDGGDVWGGNMDEPNPNGPGYMLKKDENGDPIVSGALKIEASLVDDVIWQYVFRPALEDDCPLAFESMIREWCEDFGLAESCHRLLGGDDPCESEACAV